MATPTKILTVEELRRYAPSVFATRADAKVSDAYSFIPTVDVVQGLVNEGWLPTSAQEQNVRLDSRESFAKHVVRFTREEYINTPKFIGQLRPEIVLINSHDRSSSFQVSAGVWRLICLNGLTIPDSVFGELRMRHTGLSTRAVLRSANAIVEGVPAILDHILQLQSYVPTEQERQVLAVAAHALRWEDPTKAPVTPAKLLVPRRYEDQHNDLWTTFNVIQENLIKGGQRDSSRRNENGRRRGLVRAVTSIDEDISINKNLWTLADMVKNGTLMG